MSDSTRVERRLTDEERIKKVQEDARKSKYQLTVLSIIGVLAFLLIWQFAVMGGLLPNRYVPMPSEVVKLFFVKWVE